MFSSLIGLQGTDKYNVNPGLTNHGLLIRGYSSNSHNPILKWYPPPIKQPKGLLIQVDIIDH